jgi:hypothetical protein
MISHTILLNCYANYFDLFQGLKKVVHLNYYYKNDPIKYKSVTV